MSWLLPFTVCGLLGWRLLAVVDVMGPPGLAVGSLFQLRSVLADDGFVRCAWVWRLRVDGGGCAISLNQEPNLGPRLTWDVLSADDDMGGRAPQRRAV